MIVAIEGGDQAGKKTQSRMLANALKKRRVKTKIFSFPDYSTPIGKQIRRYLDGKTKFPPQVIHCLLAANRWEKLEEIKKADQKNSVLIMNRYYHSNFVYGIVNGMKLDWLEGLDKGLPQSDLVIVLDVSQKEAFSRKNSKRDVFEKNKLFSQKISKAYRKLAKKKHWKLIDASGSKQDVHNQVMKVFAKKLGI